MFTLSPEEQQIIGLSLKVAATATLFSLPPGVALAYLLSRYSFPGKALLSGLTHLPLILPPVVTGYALLLLFGRSGPLGRLLEPMGIVFAFDWTGAALAAAVMGFPLLVRAVRLSFDMVDPRIESAAGTDPRRRADRPVPDHYPAARLARRCSRNGAGVRQGAR